MAKSICKEPRPPPPLSELCMHESTLLPLLSMRVCVYVCVCVASTYNTHIQIELTGKRQVPRACHQWRHPGEGEDSTQDKQRGEVGGVGGSLSTRQVGKSSSHLVISSVISSSSSSIRRTNGPNDSERFFAALGMR